jgi:hypothetical protein
LSTTALGTDSIGLAKLTSMQQETLWSFPKYGIKGVLTRL